jgi:SH3-like domain-containing protein
VSGRLRSCRLGAALALGALAAGLTMAAPASESLYVVEQLVVNVNSAPDASGERIATVKSGERVEVLERVRDQVHVRLGNGSDGWIRAGYLSADEPLRARLIQRDAEVAQLREEVSGLQGELSAARAAAAAGDAGANGTAAAPAAAARGSEDAAAAPPAAGALFTPAADERPLRVWPWALGSALLALCLGFVLGAVVLDRHIRRKYGGLRIY